MVNGWRKTDRLQRCGGLSRRYHSKESQFIKDLVARYRARKVADRTNQKN
jgi:hypothetical protein